MEYRSRSEPPPSFVVDVRPGQSPAPRRKLPAFWRLFFVVRVGLLLGVLTIVLVWGFLDHRARLARLDWERPLEVALVLVEQTSLDPATVRAFRDRIPQLENHLSQEFSKYQSASSPPVRFYVYGPVTGPAPPPPTAQSGVVDQLLESIARLLYAQKLDRLAGVPLFGFDSRIYIDAHPPRRDSAQFVEGFSEHGGRNGFVDVELDPSMVDFALFVTVHELFHTLGATDKYADDGTTILPLGLVAPKQQPLFPQAQAEVMARGRPLRPGVEDVPSTLRELGVGPSTARELRWLR